MAQSSLAWAIVIVLSTGTDLALQHSIFPSLDTPQVGPGLLGLALAYRTAYGIFAGWVTARSAPRRALAHALVLGATGTLVAGAGVIVMWGYGQHWYPIALTLLALPQSWLGGRLATMRRSAIRTA